MCWTATVSVAMVGVGAVATGVTIMRGMPPAIPAAAAYFTSMELLQAAGYAVINQCGTPANEVITFLSILHIVFQPFFINAFALELVPHKVKMQTRTRVYIACAMSSIIMILQLYPFDWAGSCRIGASLCGNQLCTVSGQWHLAWDVPYNGLLVPLENLVKIYFGFPTYMIVAFLLPLVYGAWRFVIFHALAGPIFASSMTSNPNEVPAIWCLFSIGILLISISPLIRVTVENRSWYGWGKTGS